MNATPHIIQADTSHIPLADESVPCVVLDPFGGSGTTAVAAMKHGRRGVMLEPKSEYIELARKRIAEWRPGNVKRKRRSPERMEPCLFEAML